MFCCLMPIAACLFLCQSPVAEEVVAAIHEPILQAESMPCCDGSDAGSIRHDEMTDGFFDEPSIVDAEEWGDLNPEFTQRFSDVPRKSMRGMRNRMAQPHGATARRTAISTSTWRLFGRPCTRHCPNSPVA